MSSRLQAVLVLVLVSAWAISSPSAGPNTPSPAADPLLKTADKVAQKTAKLRGLKLLHPIKRGVMNKAQLTERLKNRIDQEYSASELASEELLLKRFGMLEPKADYLEIVLKLLTGQIAGFYDPWEQQLYLASFQTVGGDMILAHEIDHALQDQHFNLRKFMKVDKANNDAMVARQALVEGEGMAIMIEYMFDELGQAPPWGQDSLIKQMSSFMAGAVGSGDLSRAPLFLREGLIFPYMEGLKFVANYRRHNPWSRLDKIYKKPPLSSEHIMHPDKYDAYERPVTVESTPLPSLGGHVIRHSNVHGEFGTALFLRQHKVAKAQADIAAAGWAGDRIAVYSPQGSDALSKAASAVLDSVGVSFTVWDELPDALEYFDALHLAMPSIAGGVLVSKSPTKLVYFMPSGKVAAVERKDDKVVLIIGVAKVQLDRLLADIWASWRVKDR